MHGYILEIPFSTGEAPDTLYPTILSSGAETILVDCGYPGFLPLLEQAAEQHGLSLDELTGVLITHHDMDHMGALAELKRAYPSLTVYAPEEEAPYISGEKKSLRLLQAERLFDHLPDEHKPGALAFQDMLRKIEPIAVDVAFSADGELSFLKGVVAVHTPGHMPGHISLYLPDSRTLLAADAVVYANGQLEIANPAYTLDLPQAVASVQKLMALPIDTLICYHGGVVRGNIRKKLGALNQHYVSV